MRLEGKSLKSDFLRFIIPSIIAQWVFSLYTMVDGIFVARGVSEVALTAVNISMPFTTGLFSVSILFAVGNSTIVAIFLGQGEKQKANEVFTQNVVLLCILSVLITILVMIFLDPFARFLGATDHILPYARTYIGTIAPFSVVYILSYSFETMIKTDGYPKLATIYVTSGAVLNCILDYILVMVLHKGVWGAAFATGISQAAVILLYLWHFLGPKGTIRFSKFHLMPSEIGRQIRNGMSSGITEFSSGIIIFFFNQAILKYIGEYALVSYTIISYVNTIVVMSMAGIAQGTQPLISYYYGKNESEKYKKLLKYGMVAAAAGSVAAALICYVGAESIVGLFLKESEASLSVYSVRVLRIFILSFLLAGLNVVLGGYFASVEKAGFATTISLTRSLIALVISLVFLTAVFGGEAIWWAPLIAESCCLMLSAGLYQWYRKK
ncbi:Multidrug export protein MepA [Dorea longicatena]|uniref:Multidrug export protein MepA n=1 Tax=Dorea longicatena TaxID=88431 RepID=A0A564T4W5_9FIRM|nr:MATE family efflux transporter [Dorea longicatena]VUX02487.1 Multidrug export protein MepA [Dorea longicatena]